MFKNLTLHQVTSLLAVIFTTLHTTVLIILSLSGVLHLKFIWWIVIVVISLGVSYFFILFLLDRFLFRKIKLIYKLINNSKKNYLSPSTSDIWKPSLAKVNEDVLDWAREKQQEIDYLNELESYRKSYLGNISHELKTPLFSIQGYLLTLIEGALYDEKVNLKYIKRALVNLERLERIIEDLETINNLEAGNIELNMSHFDLKQMTLEVLEDLQLLAEEKSIRLMLKDGASKAFTIIGDEDRIRQVMNNLVTNSIKYGKQGGVTKIGFYDMIQNVLIEVTDNGKGIEEMHLKHIFDRFYRVDRGRARNVGGSGLGLAIVKHIVEAHDGTVSVRSTVGAGSTFSVTLNKKVRNK